MSLRWRWAATLAVVAAVAIGAAIAAALVATRSELNGQIDRDLVQRISFPDRMDTQFPRVPEGGLGRRVGRSPLVDLDAVVQVIDSSGTVAFKVDAAKADLPIDDQDLALATAPGEPILRDVEIDGVAHRMITAHVGDMPATFFGLEIGAVQVAVDTSGVDEAVATLTRELLLLGAIGIALVAGTGWLLAGRAVGPIQRLTATAESVAVTERLDTALDEEAPGEIGRLAASFGSMLRSLETSRRQQQRLVSDASHEFRTPLTALKTSLETLQRRDEKLGVDQRRELIEAALRESDQLAELSAELVALATDVQHSDEPTDHVALDDVAEAVAQQYRRRTSAPIETKGSGSTVVARRSQLERAVGNLVDNATKWNGDGHPIVIHLDGGRIEVHDGGPGIPDGDLPHVFERFYRSVESRSMPGSGLGLAIVEHIVTAHGGTVFAANDPEGGAVVGFELPT